ncbi:MAG: DUF4411 family protein [Chthonomonas sp.]|nr:DUF4411 family protein [Chthonomonas sp.]
MSHTFYWDNNIMTWLVDRYPIPKLHELVDSQIQNGHLKVCEHVYDEAMGSPAKSWAMQRRDEVLVPMTTEILLVLRDVLEQLPAFVDHAKPKGKDADQYFVATVLAHQRGVGQNLLSGSPVLVTAERNMQGRETRMRIPDACEALGIPCVDFHGWLDLCGYRIDMVRTDGGV